METKLADANNFLDLNGLNSIKVQARSRDKEAKNEALKEAAKQFEGIFMQMLLKSMRQAEDVLASDSPFNSDSTKFYRDMQDQQMALDMSNKGSLGLSDLIVRQLGGDDTFTPHTVLRTDGSASSIKQLEDAKSSLSTAMNANSLENQDKLAQLAEQFLRVGNQNKSDEVSNNRHNSVEKPPVSSPEIDNTLEKQTNFEQPKDFVSAMTEPAKKVQQTLGIPFEVVIAQAALETGWGQKIIKTAQGQSSNNLFNIKADSRWQGEKTNKDTLEFEGGNLVKKNEPFRVYDTIEESLSDYTSFLTSGSRYKEALSNPKNVEHFLHGLQKAGYATDPNYANKILGTLNKVSDLLSN